MTNEELRQTGEAMIAFSEGKKVQRLNSDGAWMDIVDPLWSPFGFYRAKPEPKIRAWSKPSDVPGPVCWMRRIIEPENMSMVIGINPDGIDNLVGRRIVFERWDELVDQEWSTDFKAWNLCTVTEE